MMASDAGVRVQEKTLFWLVVHVSGNLLVCAFIYYEVCDDVVAHVGM